MIRRSDLALAYAAVVTVIAVALAFASDATHDRVIAETSTNLHNLHDHPLWVLFASAFVVSSLGGLWQLLLLLPLYATAQQWVGRLATIIVAAIGHVGATLFVATLLSAGIFHRWLNRGVARASDVGISYGLAALAGFLVLHVPQRWRTIYLVAALVYFGAPLLFAPSFTAMGHASALLLGLSLAWLAHRVAAAQSRAQPTG